MCQYSAVDGVMGAWHRQHLGSLAVSGAAAVVIEATAVTPQGRITRGCTGLYADTQENRLREIISDIRTYSSTILGIQLGHTGRRGSIHRPWDYNFEPLWPDEGGWRTVAPSPLPFREGWPMPEVLSEAGMADILHAFEDSTRRAARLDLGLIELHGAHGYLMHQFLSPLSNQRSDAYGGTIDNRMRFPLSIVKAVRGVWPSERALGVRISATDWLDGGWNVNDSIVFTRELEKVGVDYVCVSSGGMGGLSTALTSEHLRLAEQIRGGTSVAICGVGHIYRPQQAEDALSAGQADFVALGRAFLDNPRWALHAAVALRETPPFPEQYALAAPDKWRGYAVLHDLS